MNTRPCRSEAKLSVVLPLLNEAGILPRLLSELKRQLESLGCDWEIVLVNDGSTDDSAELLDAMAFADRRLRIVHFSRNFGHQAAVQAGLAYAQGDAVVLMDSDGQDDPKAIRPMFESWLLGDDVVYAVRRSRKEGFVKRMLFRAFYGILQRMASIDIPRDAGNFSLLDRRVVAQLRQFNEVDRYLPGLRSWVGFEQSAIVVERLARHDGKPRVSLIGLFNLARSAIFGFSRVPLQTFYFLAFFAGCLCLGSVCMSGINVSRDLAAASWFWNMATIAFFGSMNALGIAVLGEYMIRIYDQVRQRPTFIVDRTSNIEPAPMIHDNSQELVGLLSELNSLRQELSERTASASQRDSFLEVNAEERQQAQRVRWRETKTVERP